MDKRPLASTLQQLQRMLDQFDQYYNNHRPHHRLPGRMTPAMAWNATAVAAPPQPKQTTTTHRR
ncbi:integrase core domain-containing protein [Corynebacterium uterequi]